ncbi:hypothetical protein CDIK_0052 [Cucumispora dikerogammari]|nr:hypothetical protein CDIK_0052 [Cucumispora dikerogammari]
MSFINKNNAGNQIGKSESYFESKSVEATISIDVDSTVEQARKERSPNSLETIKEPLKSDIEPESTLLINEKNNELSGKLKEIIALFNSVKDLPELQHKLRYLIPQAPINNDTDDLKDAFSSTGEPNESQEHDNYLPQIIERLEEINREIHKFDSTRLPLSIHNVFDFKDLTMRNFITETELIAKIQEYLKLSVYSFATRNINNELVELQTVIVIKKDVSKIWSVLNCQTGVFSEWIKLYLDQLTKISSIYEDADGIVGGANKDIYGNEVSDIPSSKHSLIQPVIQSSTFDESSPVAPPQSTIDYADNNSLYPYSSQDKTAQVDMFIQTSKTAEKCPINRGGIGLSASSLMSKDVLREDVLSKTDAITDEQHSVDIPDILVADGHPAAVPRDNIYILGLPNTTQIQSCKNLINIKPYHTKFFTDTTPLSENIAEYIKRSLRNDFISNNTSIESITEVNESLFQNTKFYITNLDEWAVTSLVRLFVEDYKKRGVFIRKTLSTAQSNNNSGIKQISSQVYSLNRIFENLSKYKTTRIKKVEETKLKTIQRLYTDLNDFDSEKFIIYLTDLDFLYYRLELNEQTKLELQQSLKIKYKIFLRELGVFCKNENTTIVNIKEEYNHLTKIINETNIKSVGIELYFKCLFEMIIELEGTFNLSFYLSVGKFLIKYYNNSKRYSFGKATKTTRASISNGLVNVPEGNGDNHNNKDNINTETGCESFGEWLEILETDCLNIRIKLNRGDYKYVKADQIRNLLKRFY